jgi:acyl-CoA thioesterase I
MYVKKSPCFIIALLISVMLCLAFFGLAVRQAVAAPIRIACVGDSITENSGYTAKLQELLGPMYNVTNFGVTGSSVSMYANMPYMSQAEFIEAKNYKPDIVIIMLGTNDAKQEIYTDDSTFEVDYSKLINAFQELEGSQLIWLVRSPTILSNNNPNFNDTILREKVIPYIDNTAKQMKLPTINLYNIFEDKADYFSDGVHPNEEGATIIASTIYEAITLPDGSPDDTYFTGDFSG